MVEKPEGPPDEEILVLHELAEALTALGNFVVAAERLSDGDKPSSDAHRQILAKALVQHERASVAAHRLRQLITHRRGK